MCQTNHDNQITTKIDQLFVSVKDDTKPQNSYNGNCLNGFYNLLTFMINFFY